MSQTDTNKHLIAQHFDRFNAGDLDGAVAMMAPDLVNHAAIPQAQGRTGARAIIAKLKAAFPDMRLTVESTIAEGDQVVCRLSVTGTHDGTLDFAKISLPPTGKRFKTTHIHVFRVVDGVVVERWAERDDLGLLQQLGLMPSLINVAPSQDVRS